MGGREGNSEEYNARGEAVGSKGAPSPQLRTKRRGERGTRGREPSDLLPEAKNSRLEGGERFYFRYFGGNEKRGRSGEGISGSLRKLPFGRRSELRHGR